MHFDRAANQELEHQLERLYSEADEAQRQGDEQLSEKKKQEAEQKEKSETRRHPLLGDFQREPSAAAINAVHNAGDKGLELGWVYTVIAGVLNILVIYDALAGPAFRDPKELAASATSQQQALVAS